MSTNFDDCLRPDQQTDWSAYYWNLAEKSAETYSEKEKLEIAEDHEKFDMYGDDLHTWFIEHLYNEYINGEGY